jgi:hypothetical protein
MRKMPATEGSAVYVGYWVGIGLGIVLGLSVKESVNECETFKVGLGFSEYRDIQN